MPRFPLHKTRFDDVSQIDLDPRSLAAVSDGEEVLVVDERCRQSRSCIVDEKFSQLVTLAAARFSSYSAASTN